MRPSWISDPNDVSHLFLSTALPDTYYPLSSQLAFRLRRICVKQLFKIAAVAAVLDFLSKRF